MIVGNMGNFSNISMKAINIDNNCLGLDFLEREVSQCDVACVFFLTTC